VFIIKFSKKFSEKLRKSLKLKYKTYLKVAQIFFAQIRGKVRREKPGVSKPHRSDLRRNPGFNRNRRLVFRRLCEHPRRSLCHARLTYANTRKRVRQSDCPRWKIRDFQQLKGNCEGRELESWWRDGRNRARYEKRERPGWKFRGLGMVHRSRLHGCHA